MLSRKLRLTPSCPALATAAGRKSCAITCATRLGSFLGDERIKDKVQWVRWWWGWWWRGGGSETGAGKIAVQPNVSSFERANHLMLQRSCRPPPRPPTPLLQGLVCNYVIARSPPNLPTSERAIPVAIFRCSTVRGPGRGDGVLCPLTGRTLNAAAPISPASPSHCRIRQTPPRPLPLPHTPRLPTRSTEPSVARTVL